LTELPALAVTSASVTAGRAKRELNGARIPRSSGAMTLRHLVAIAGLQRPAPAHRRAATDRLPRLSPTWATL